MSKIDLPSVDLATALAQRGIRAVMHHRQPESVYTSRAAVAHARALELLVTDEDSVGAPVIARSWWRTS
jgi:hypothetical protein